MTSGAMFCSAAPPIVRMEVERQTGRVAVLEVRLDSRLLRRVEVGAADSRRAVGQRARMTDGEGRQLADWELVEIGRGDVLGRLDGGRHRVRCEGLA